MPEYIDWNKLAKSYSYDNPRDMLNGLRMELGYWKRVATYLGVSESHLKVGRDKFLTREENYAGIYNPTWYQRAEVKGFNSPKELINSLLNKYTIPQIARMYKVKVGAIHKAILKYCAGFLSERELNYTKIKKRKIGRLCRNCGEEIEGPNYFFCERCHREKSRLCCEDLEEHHVAFSGHWMTRI